MFLPRKLQKRSNAGRSTHTQGSVEPAIDKLNDNVSVHPVSNENGSSSAIHNVDQPASKQAKQETSKLDRLVEFLYMRLSPLYLSLSHTGEAGIESRSSTRTFCSTSTISTRKRKSSPVNSVELALSISRDSWHCYLVLARAASPSACCQKRLRVSQRARRSTGFCCTRTHFCSNGYPHIFEPDTILRMSTFLPQLPRSWHLC